MNLRQLNRVLLQTLLLPVVAIGLVAGALAWQLLDAERAVNSMEVADANIATASMMLALVVDQNNGLRAYQTTGNEIFLQPYDFAREPLRMNGDKLREGLRRQGADLDAVEGFRRAHSRWVRTIAEPIIATIQAGGDTRDPGLNLRAKAQVEYMQRLLDSIVHDQEGHRLRAVEHWQSQLRHTLEALLGFALVLGLLIGAFARNRLDLVSDAFQATLTALRRHAQATYDSEQRLRAILISLGEAAVVCGLDGAIELMNPAAEQLSGWDQNEAVGKPFETVFPLRSGPVAAETDSPVAAVRRELRTVTSTEPLRLSRRDGSELIVEHSGAPVNERTGELAGIVLVLRDVTRQRRTQAALLASEKLAVAGRLAATIAHEIHNPLDSVANLLYLMKTSNSPGEIDEFLDTARSELDRATQISRALLGMYRESRTAVAVDLSSLLDSVLLLMERRLIQSGIHVDRHMLSPAIVTGFPVELRQVFTNLLTNAADASPTGSTISVTVSASLAAAPDDRTGFKNPGILVAIRDHGPGIPEDIRRQLFQPFFSTKGEAGTGLGLWVSKGIVQKHDGILELASSTDPQNHGTEVSVFVPRGTAPLIEEDRHTVEAGRAQSRSIAAQSPN